jgi:hypothetical protein
MKAKLYYEEKVNILCLEYKNGKIEKFYLGGNPLLDLVGTPVGKWYKAKIQPAKHLGFIFISNV